MNMVSCIAIDLGASSGRVILSKFDGKRIELEEIYRFPNQPIKLGDRLYWNFLGLYSEIIEGLKMQLKKGKHSKHRCGYLGVDYGHWIKTEI